MGGGGQRHAPAALPPEKIHGTHCAEGSMRPRVGLNGCGNSPPPPPGIDPRTLQPLASRFTDCDIPTHNFLPYWFTHNKPYKAVKLRSSQPTHFAAVTCSTFFYGSVTNFEQLTW